MVLSLNEAKLKEVFMTVAQAGQVGSMGSLTPITAGTGLLQRIGNKVVMKNLQLRGRIYYDWLDTALRGAYATHCRVRILIFIWKDDTVPTPGDIINPPAGFLLQDTCSYFLDPDRKPKRKLLYDGVYDIRNDSQYTAPGVLNPIPGPESEKSINLYIDLTRLPLALRTISYAGAGTTDGVNNMYMYVMADAEQTGAAYTGPKVRINSRLTFTDA